MAINQTWRPRGGWGDIFDTYTLVEAGYLVNGLNPQSPNTDHPAEVLKAIRDMKRDLKNNPYENWYSYQRLQALSIGDEIPPENIYVNATFIRKWADNYGATDFFNSQVSEPLTESERDILLKHIGLLSLVLAEKGGKYKKGSGKPNASQIASEAQLLIDAGNFAGKKGTRSTLLRESIAKGLKLLSISDD